MKKNFWLGFFIVVLLGELAGIQLDAAWLQYVCKPLIMPCLAGYFLDAAGPRARRFNAWILIAFFFSWAGDVLLMFQEKNSLFFLAGLSAFLLAHLAYIVFFHRVRLSENISPRPLLLVIVVLYYAGLIYLLSPFLGDMKIPVRVYGIVICFMFMLAMHMLFIENKKAGRYMMTGALLFILSDSLLALNKFFRSFEAAGILVMLTYAGAQYFIAAGATRYSRSVKSH